MQYYPPLIEGKLPAFAIDPDPNSTGKITFNIPYRLNKAVSTEDFSRMAIMIKTVTTGTVKLDSDTQNCAETYYRASNNLYSANFIIDRNTGENDISLTTFTPTIGNYYKI
jgi:myo-inositol-hexaphosphate 3-phosphohydrolase